MVEVHGTRPLLTLARQAGEDRLGTTICAYLLLDSKTRAPSRRRQTRLVP